MEWFWYAFSKDGLVSLKQSVRRNVTEVFEHCMFLQLGCVSKLYHFFLACFFIYLYTITFTYIHIFIMFCLINLDCLYIYIYIHLPVNIIYIHISRFNYSDESGKQKIHCFWKSTPVWTFTAYPFFWDPEFWPFKVVVMQVSKWWWCRFPGIHFADPKLHDGYVCLFVPSLSNTYIQIHEIPLSSLSKLYILGILFQKKRQVPRVHVCVG